MLSPLYWTNEAGDLLYTLATCLFLFACYNANMCFLTVHCSCNCEAFFSLLVIFFCFLFFVWFGLFVCLFFVKLAKVCWTLVAGLRQSVFLGTDRNIKGTNGRQKTYEIFPVYCIFYSGFMCQTTAIFGITKDGGLVLNILASWNRFTCRNLFQNGASDMSECLTCETAFCKKAQNFV